MLISYWNMYKYAVAVPAIPHLSFNVANIIKSIYGKNKKSTKFAQTFHPIFVKLSGAQTHNKLNLYLYTVYQKFQLRCFP